MVSIINRRQGKGCSRPFDDNKCLAVYYMYHMQSYVTIHCITASYQTLIMFSAIMKGMTRITFWPKIARSM